MKQILFLAFFIITALSVFAQNGVLRGRISDNTKQVLPGATVYIEELKNGVVSDVNGFYIFPKIPAGKYQVKVSYVGYKDQSFNITIAEEKTIEKNIALEDEAQQLDEVTVGGTFHGYQRAMNYQKTSLNGRNVISADQVGRFPDANIGDAMKRISGINVQYDQGEARFGQIRGTSPDLSSVTINGNRLPSAEGDVRNVQLDLIPSDMIQTIVVNKVVTPDMDADAIGGSVNLITKSSPAKRVIAGTIGSGWNFISDRMQANAALTYGDNFFNNKLGLMVSASYQNNPIGSDNVEFEWEKDDDGKVYVSNYEIRQYYVQRERQSYSASLGYRLNLNNRIDFKGIYNRRNDWENRYRQRIKDLEPDGSNGKVIYQTKGGSPDNKNARLERQETMDLSLNGEHLFKTTLFNWNLSYATASEKRPNERYIAFARKKVNFTPDLSNTRKPMMSAEEPADMILGDGYKLDELIEQHQDIKETDFKGSFNFNIPVRIAYETGNLKFGAKVVAKSKKRDLEFYDYEPTKTNDAFTSEAFKNLSNQTRSDFYAGDYKAGSFVSKQFLGGLALNNSHLFEKTENPEELADIFDANETVSAGFIRYDQNISSKLSAMAGIRLENTHIRYQGKRLDIPAEDDPDGEITLSDTPENTDRYLNVLPSVLLKYSLTDATIFRLSYTNTLARPKYYDLVPHVSIDRDKNAVEVGNPELKPTLSHNVDLSSEYYFPTFGMVSAGVYFKKINDFIVDQRSENAEYDGTVYEELVQPKNGGSANLIGVELSWQRDFGFIAPALKYFGFYANYTYTHSKIKNFNIERKYDDATTAASDKDLKMPGSPEHIANVSLYYERKGLNVRLSYNFASEFIDEFGKNAFYDRYYDKVNYLDANASYSFAKHYTVFAEANNLLNQPLRYYQGTASRTAQAEYYGPKLSAGLKINF